MRRNLLIPFLGALTILVAAAFVLWYGSIERQSDVETLRDSISLFVSVILLIAAVSGWLLYRMVLTLYVLPLRELKEVAELAGRGELRRTATIQRDDDVGELSKAINAMIADLRRAREEAVAESERRFRELVESSNAIPWEYDPTAERFVYVGPNASGIFGYAQEDWYEPGFWTERLHPEDRGAALAFFHGALRGQETEIEYRMRAADGREVWMRDIVTSTGGAAGIGRVRGVRFDVTDRRVLQEQLFRSQRLEAVGQLAGGIAHDFNNLLTVISGGAAAARLEVPENATVLEDLAEIERAARRAGALTHQLLAYARKQVASPQVVDLNAVLRDLEGMLRRLTGTSVEISLEIADGLWPVRVDLGQIEQVVTNLVVNARDASPEGATVQLSTENVEVTRRRPDRPHMPPGQYVRLKVSDRGVGMDAATRDRIFEPFFSTKGVGEGTGLGLATCYGIIKQSRGFIWVESAPGEGSEFEVYLPRVADGTAAEATRAGAAPAAEPGSTHGSETVLLVDDEDSVRRLTERTLARFGYRVVPCANGHEALARAADDPEGIDLLMTDIMMPEMGGREVAERVRALIPGVRVLYTSGYSPDRFFAPRDLGSDQAFLQKPFIPSTLAAAVRELLDRGRE